MTKRLPLVIVLILFLTSLAYAQEATPSPSPAPKPAMTRAQSQRTIIATEKKLWEAWKNKDAKAFKSNLSADSIQIGESGVGTKNQIVEAMSNSDCEVKSYALSDIKVTFFNNSTALVTYKGTQDATCAGQAVPAAVWSSSLYVMRGGKWLAASRQETTAK